MNDQADCLVCWFLEFREPADKEAFFKATQPVREPLFAAEELYGIVPTSAPANAQSTTCMG